MLGEDFKLTFQDELHGWTDSGQTLDRTEGVAWSTCSNPPMKSFVLLNMDVIIHSPLDSCFRRNDIVISRGGVAS